MGEGAGRQSGRPDSSLWRIGSLLKEAGRFLARKGIAESRLEAELLLAHSLSLDRVALYASFSKPLESTEVDAFRDLVKRRIAGEPTAYLVGVKEFFSLDFHVTPAVLIPRPETEELVQSILDVVPGDGSGYRLGDLGTGSGCIAVTAARLCGKIEVEATDISEEALVVAARNAERHDVGGRVAFLQGDMAEPLFEAGSPGRFQVLACNPPYIDPEGPLDVDPDVARFEPREALFTPPGDPLHFYCRVLSRAGSLLAPRGVVFFEIAEGMEESVEEAGRRFEFEPFFKRRDLAGKWRVVGFKTARGGRM